jgi:hypothetical protein
MPCSFVSRCLVIGAVLGLASTASAQPAASNRTLIALNPLGIPFDVFQAEIERSLDGGTTVGAVVSYVDVDRKRNRTVDLKWRYYPAEGALSRFSTGISVGYTNFNRDVFREPDFRQERGSLNAATVGVIVDYNWVHGSRRRFVVGTGVGAKRVLASADTRAPFNVERAYLTGRFVIGLLY